MDGAITQSWVLVALNVSSLKDLVSIGNSCKTLRERILLRNDVLQPVCARLLPPLAYQHIMVAKSNSASTLYPLVVNLWLRRMTPFAHGIKLADLKFDWPQRKVFSKFRWMNSHGTLACWMDLMYMGRKCMQPPVRECGDEFAIVCGVARFEIAAKKILFSMKPKPLNFKYFALEDTAKVAQAS